MLGNPEGLEFGFGVRASNAQWNASMGSTASAAYATAYEAAKTAQGELDLLDPAARVTYGSKQGDTRWNAVGYVGEDWAGAGLSIKF